MRNMVLGLAALVLTAGVAEAREFRVPTRGLDLRDPAQAEQFYARAQKEARRVCNAESILVQVLPRLQRECVDDLTASLVAKVDTPAFTAAARAGKPVNGAYVSR